MFATIIDTILTVGTLTDLFPETTFAADMTDEDFAAQGVFRVLQTRSYDASTQKLQVSQVYEATPGIYYNVRIVDLTTEDAQLLKTNLVLTNFRNAVNAGFTYQTNVYDIDDKAQLNMLSVQTMFILGTDNAHGGHWRTMDNINVSMTDTEVKVFLKAAYGFKIGIIRAAQVAKDAITAATSVTEVNAVDTTLGV